MAIVLPKLPYALDALEPHMSRETLEVHHGKHHKTYVEKTNRLLAEKHPELAKLPLEELLLKAEGELFNNAAQVWNHNFFWKCLTPEEQPVPEELRHALERQFANEDRFEKQFSEIAAALFGSGWTWLVRNEDQSLAIVTTANGDNPLTEGRMPLLACDVWEHAYYIDYRNDRAQYLQHFFPLVNWEFVGANLAAPARPQARRSRDTAAQQKYH
jgi:Fe-Mn family superoxide dismutase